MLYKQVARILGFYLMGLGMVMVIPFLLALYYQFGANPEDHLQPHSALAFFYTILICLGCGAVLFYWGRQENAALFRRESILAVVLIWILSPAFACLPFMFSGTLTNFWQGYYEISSGFTTTGSTILQAKKFGANGEEIAYEYTVPGVIETHYVFNGTVEPVRNPQTGEIEREGIEAVSKALLFWRSLTQWLGGAGIVVLFIAILPAIGIGGKWLYQTEVPGPTKDAMTPRIKETAIQLWKIYIGLTLLQIFALMWAHSSMGLFDAVNTSFSTISTGGFSVKNLGISSYQSASVEWIVIIFMILGSINFSLYYFITQGKFYKVYDPELIVFLSIIVLMSFGISYYIWNTPNTDTVGAIEGIYSLRESVRNGAFQLVSAITTTGYFTTNYDVWPYLPQVLMLTAMFIGGMSGSTAGGIKIIRLFILFKAVQHRVEALFRPENVRLFRIRGIEIPLGAVLMVLCFFVIVVGLSTIAVMLYTWDHVDPETAIGLVACHLNNTGIAFRAAGPMNSFAFLTDFGLILSSLLMLLGRLEYFAVLALLVPAFWKHDS